MSTPPTGEDPHWRPAPDESPTTPQQPSWTPPGQQPAYGPPPTPQPSYGPPAQQPFHGPPSGPQLAYGSPTGWQPGPPPTPTRDRKRTWLIAALVVVALLIAAGVALLVYVLSSTILDRAAVEQAVSSQFEEREGVALDLECSRRMIVRPGADYECEGTTADGEEVEIRIEITDENGAYTWAEE